LTESDIDAGIAATSGRSTLGPAETLALLYSERMATDPQSIDAAFYAELRKYYSDEEIVELGTFIGFNIGYHTFFGTLKFYPLFSPDGRLVSQEESARLYGARPVSLSPSGRI
jgi:hypothetical protein